VRKPFTGGSGLVPTCGLMRLGEESLGAFRAALSEMPKQRVDRCVAALNSGLCGSRALRHVLESNRSFPAPYDPSVSRDTHLGLTGS